MFYKRGNASYCFIILAGFLCYLEIMLQWFSLLVCFEAFKRRLDLNGKGKIIDKGNCQIWWYFMNCISYPALCYQTFFFLKLKKILEGRVLFSWMIYSSWNYPDSWAKLKCMSCLRPQAFQSINCYLHYMKV